MCSSSARTIPDRLYIFFTKEIKKYPGLPEVCLLPTLYVPSDSATRRKNDAVRNIADKSARKAQRPLLRTGLNEGTRPVFDWEFLWP